MYTVTFYSFKGGVGRTMALVNTALALALDGRRVVLIDFDLEAPGLTTFDRLRPSGAHAGIVEYVARYLETGDPPEIDDYSYRPLSSVSGLGDIFVIPAGKEDATYRRTLAEINWLNLYEQRSGFLLFEDLKYQIQYKYSPDYLLIDSRTGHSDVEGICTRHLPDAVVVLFFPNEQNLCGLDSVCRNIRAEKEAGLKKDICLHFAMSNVPDLDDEDAILKRRISDFRRRLRFKKLATIINHYNSLTLLNQSIFVLERPASRLAKQYRKLLDAIVKENLTDKSGALDFLRDVLATEHTAGGSQRDAAWLQGAEKRINSISNNFSDDVDVQFNVARALMSLGHVMDAQGHLDRLLSRFPHHIEGRMERASCRATLGETAGAVEDLIFCLRQPDLKEWQAISTVRLLASLEIESIGEVAGFLAAHSLSPNTKYLIVDGISRYPKAWPTHSIRTSLMLLLEDVLEHSDHPMILEGANIRYTLFLMWEGRWDEAIERIGSQENSVSSPSGAFNYAMANWGKEGVVSAAMMASVRRVIAEAEPRADANYSQCIAVVEWATGDSVKALNSLSMAEGLAQADTADTLSVFSCWRYAYVSPSEFLEDCKYLRRMILGERIIPAYIERNGRK